MPGTPTTVMAKRLDSLTGLETFQTLGNAARHYPDGLGVICGVAPPKHEKSQPRLLCLVVTVGDERLTPN